MTAPHPTFEAQVDLYLDGELAAAEARALETHLAKCPVCARFRDRRLELRAALNPCPVDDRLLIVEIDDSSLASFGRWPWPRDRQAPSNCCQGLDRDGRCLRS